MNKFISKKLLTKNNRVITVVLGHTKVKFIDRPNFKTLRNKITASIKDMIDNDVELTNDNIAEVYEELRTRFFSDCSHMPHASEIKLSVDKNNDGKSIDGGTRFSSSIVKMNEEIIKELENATFEEEDYELQKLELQKTRKDRSNYFIIDLNFHKCTKKTEAGKFTFKELDGKIAVYLNDKFINLVILPSKVTDCSVRINGNDTMTAINILAHEMIHIMQMYEPKYKYAQIVETFYREFTPEKLGGRIETILPLSSFETKDLETNFPHFENSLYYDKLKDLGIDSMFGDYQSAQMPSHDGTFIQRLRKINKEMLEFGHVQFGYGLKTDEEGTSKEDDYLYAVILLNCALSEITNATYSDIFETKAKESEFKNKYKYDYQIKDAFRKDFLNNVDLKLNSKEIKYLLKIISNLGLDTKYLDDNKRITGLVLAYIIKKNSNSKYIDLLEELIKDRFKNKFNLNKFTYLLNNSDKIKERFNRILQYKKLKEEKPINLQKSINETIKNYVKNSQRINTLLNPLVDKLSSHIPSSVKESFKDKLRKGLGRIKL